MKKIRKNDIIYNLSSSYIDSSFSKCHWALARCARHLTGQWAHGNEEGLILVQWQQNVNAELQAQDEKCCNVERDTDSGDPRGTATPCISFSSKLRQDKLRHMKPGGTPGPSVLYPTASFRASLLKSTTSNRVLSNILCKEHTLHLHCI